MEVNHKDNVRHNNRLSNLEYCTKRQNMLHAKKQHRLNQGEIHPRARMINDDIFRIRRLYDLGASLRDIGYLHGLGDEAVRKIGKRQSWSHLPEEKKRPRFPAREEG